MSASGWLIELVWNAPPGRMLPGARGPAHEQRVVLAEWRRLRYDRLVLATGGRPRRLTLADAGVAYAAANVHELRTIEDARRLRDRLASGAQLVVIGGGYIGLEVAATAVGIGASVTVLEALPRVLLARVTAPVVSAFYEQVHRSAGVDVRTRFWSDQYDLKLQTVGLGAGHDQLVLRGDPEENSFLAFYRRGRMIPQLVRARATRRRMNGPSAERASLTAAGTAGSILAGIMGSGPQQTRADARPNAAEPERSALEPDPARSLAVPHDVSTPVLALQRLIGNRATGRLLAGRGGASRGPGTGSRAGVARLLARAPTLATRVTTAADKGAWTTVGALLSTAPMGTLLDAVAEIEASGRLTWISINLPASLKNTSLERILAAIAAVQHAPAEEQMAHRLALGPADERALAKWLDKHPEATPLPAPPTPDPITRADGTAFDPPSGVADDRGWSRALLRFMHFGPPAAPGVEACTLDGQPSTLTDVALLVAEQGLLKGNHSIDPSQARTYVDEYFAEVTAAAGKAHEIVAKVGQRDAAVIDSLSDLPIGTLLAVLDDMRAAGKIDDLIDLVTPVPPSSRVMAALLTASGHLGLRWRKAVDDMVPAEQAIVRSFLVDRVVYADTFASTPIVKKRPGEPDSGKPFTRPPGADETWAATVDDVGWVDAFLRYFKLMRVPFDDDNYWFNEVQHPLDEIIDITVEQALLAGTTGVTADVVKKVIDRNRDTLMTRAPLDPNQIVIQWTFVPVTYHKDLRSGATSHDQPANQIQVGYTIKFKNVGAWWSEIDVTGFAQGTFFADPVTKKVDFRHPKLQSFVVGAQAAWVIPLFSNKWQLQTIAQVVAGSARTYDSDSQGNITISPVSLERPNMAQAAAQVQIVYQPFDTPKLKWLQFYAGAGGSLTQVGKVQTEDGQPFFFGIGGAF